jgi:hypothetical protein
MTKTTDRLFPQRMKSYPVVSTERLAQGGGSVAVVIGRRTTDY